MEQEQDPKLTKKKDQTAQEQDSTTASESIDSDANDKVESEPKTKKEDPSESLKRLAKELEQAKKDEEPEVQSPSVDQVRSEEPAPYRTGAAKPKQRATDPAPVAKKSFSWLAFFAFIISVGTAAAVGFFWWQSQMWLKTQDQVEQLKKQSDANTLQSLNQLQSRINNLQNQLQQQKAAAGKSSSSLSSLNARVKELGQSQPNHWLASEALYLVNLAERRLLVEQDVNTAIELLLAANTRLTAMQDPSVFHIRTAISEDIAALYGVKQPDTDALYLSLSGLVSQVQSLPFKHVYEPDPIQQQKAEEISGDISDFQKNLQISLNRFWDRFVDFKPRNTPVEPELPADQKWFVRANVTTQLLMAQSALLEKNNAIYQDAIKKVQTWLPQYFDASDPHVAAGMVMLNELVQRDVELTLPTDLTSQALLANFTKAQLQLKTGIEE